MLKAPEEFDSSRDPSFVYYLFMIYSNIQSLNILRVSLGKFN
jgi:hypothetical protein